MCGEDEWLWGGPLASEALSLYIIKFQCMGHGEVNNSFSLNDDNDDDDDNNGVVENENTILSCLHKDIAALVAWR